MTGWPCGGRGTFKGPRTLRYLLCVVDPVDLAGIGEKTRRTVEQNSVVLDTVPKGFDDIEILARALIAIGMLDVAVMAKIHRLFRHRRGHDIPAGATMTEMIERSEHARQIVGLGIGSRGRRKEPDMRCYR